MEHPKLGSRGDVFRKIFGYGHPVRGSVSIGLWGGCLQGMRNSRPNVAECINILLRNFRRRNSRHHACLESGCTALILVGAHAR